MVIKKRFICLLLVVLIMILSINIKSYATTPTLEQIANAFNNCDTVQSSWSYPNNSAKAIATDNKLTITLETDEEYEGDKEFEYKLDNNVLSIVLNKDDRLGAIATYYLVDSIGQLHGYKDGELLSTLNSEDVMNYTIDNQGYEIKQLDDEKVSVKVDITKKIPLIDTNNVYIEVSDLQDLKSYISGDGFAEKSKGNIWFNKSGYNGENTLLIAEKDNLTENTYKSILSIIEVMFDSSKASDYFKTNYSGMSVGNKEFAGIKIEINPTKTETEEKLITSNSGYKFARITIDKNLVNSAIVGINSNTEKREDDNNTDNGNDTRNNSVKEQDNTVSHGNLPQTGLNVILQIVSFSIITLIAIIFYKKYNNYKIVK